MGKVYKKGHPSFLRTANGHKLTESVLLTLGRFVKHTIIPVTNSTVLSKSDTASTDARMFVHQHTHTRTHTHTLVPEDGEEKFSS